MDHGFTKTAAFREERLPKNLRWQCVGDARIVRDQVASLGYEYDGDIHEWLEAHPAQHAGPSSSKVGGGTWRADDF
jgi:hypothetical protein